MATEKRLIYMDDTMDRLRAYADRKHQAGHTELANGILKAVNYIHNEISRVDAVEVVRCKDCKHYDKDALWCNINSHMFSEEHYNWYEDAFCSYGERRTE